MHSWHSYLLVILLAGIPLRAAAVLGNLPYDGAGAAISDLSGPQRVADDVLLSGTVTVGAIQWWGTYGSQPAVLPTDAFSLVLYEDDPVNALPDETAGVPFRASLTPARLVTPLRSSDFGDALAGPVYQYVAQLPSPLTLTSVVPDTYIWISIVNNTSGARWAWLEDQPSPGTGYRAFSTSLQGDWSPSFRATNTAWQLLDTPVPEPGTGFLSFCMLVLLCALRFR